MCLRKYVYFIRLYLDSYHQQMRRSQCNLKARPGKQGSKMVRKNCQNLITAVFV